jgi:hypothetical protein
MIAKIHVEKIASIEIILIVSKVINYAFWDAV